MLSRLFRIFTAQPSLLLDHVEGYVDLVRAESGEIARHYVSRVVWGVVALAAVAVALVLGGVAVMLGVTVGAPTDGARWALIGIPVLFLLIAGVAGWAASSAQARPFEGVKRQLAQDRRLVNEWKDDVARAA